MALALIHDIGNDVNESLTFDAACRKPIDIAMWRQALHRFSAEAI